MIVDCYDFILLLCYVASVSDTISGYMSDGFATDYVACVHVAVVSFTQISGQREQENELQVSY